MLWTTRWNESVLSQNEQKHGGQTLHSHVNYVVLTLWSRQKFNISSGHFVIHFTNVRTRDPTKAKSAVPND